MTADDVLEIVRRLDDAGIEWWIHGGWGLDALLGRETRPHDDLDLAVRRADVERLEASVPEFRRLREEWPASFVLADARGRQIDIHPLRIDERGDGWQERPSGEMALWPREALAGRGRIGEREVRCTSPEFELTSHLYPGHDDVRPQRHRAALRALRAQAACRPVAGDDPSETRPRSAAELTAAAREEPSTGGHAHLIPGGTGLLPATTSSKFARKLACHADDSIS